MDPILLVVRMPIRLPVVVFVLTVRWVLRCLLVRAEPYIRVFLTTTGFFLVTVVLSILIVGVPLILAWRRERGRMVGGSGSPRQREQTGRRGREAMSVQAVAVLAGGVFLAVLVGMAWRFAVVLNRQEEALRRQHREANAGRERLFAVLRSVPDGLVVVEQGQVCLANGPAARLWGLSPGEIAGLPLRLLAERGPNLTPLVDASSHLSAPVEVRLRERIYEVSTTPVVDREGVVVLFRDVTEARQVEQLREDLTNMLVHDLRSPLASIHGAAQILDQMSSLTDEDRKVVGAILRSSTTLIGLVETILDLARLEADRMPVEAERVALAPPVSAAVEQIAFEARTKQLDLQVDVPPSVEVMGDGRLLSRVIVNLVSNAVRFTPSGKRVRITARNGANGQVILSVSDEGPGIAPEDRERIFDRFTQAGQKRQRGSAGLGLTFCKMAVEAQGGRIWVESEVGKGATFHVALPGTMRFGKQTDRPCRGGVRC